MTIIKVDNVVGIDGKFHSIDCSSLPVGFHALQWYGDEVVGEGEVEWSGRPKPPNTEINSLDDYRSFITTWNELEAAEQEAIAAEAAADAAALAAAAAAAANGSSNTG
jgi:hypothetical protein